MDFWQELAEHGRRNAEARDRAFRLFSERGGYPMAHDPFEAPADWPTLAHRLNEDVIRPVLQHDMLTGPCGQDHDAAMLETVFEIACRYAGRTTSVSKLAEEVGLSFGGDADLEEVAHYTGHLGAVCSFGIVRGRVGWFAGIIAGAAR